METQLNLFVDDKGLWRCGGRFANADILYFTKYPLDLLLSRKHPMTPLVVNDTHRRVLHNGIHDTLTEVKKNSGFQRAGV